MIGGVESAAARRPGAVAIAGWSIHVPGVDMDRAVGVPTGGPACPPDRAHELLGSRGLLGKDPATRLALCAVHRALGLPPGAARMRGAPDPTVAVVASSNFGNMAKVQDIVRTLRGPGLKEVSALDAPNASSNVVASTVAMWFRFGGPNLMVCSGATSGLDAVSLGAVLVRSGRADRAVVVAVEPEDPVACGLHAARTARRENGVRFCAGAAAVVLEPLHDGTASGPVLGRFHEGVHVADDDPSCVLIGPREHACRGGRVIDLCREIGDPYGALGVLQAAVAAAVMASEPPAKCSSVAIVCGDAADGWRSSTVTRAAVMSSAGSIS